MSKDVYLLHFQALFSDSIGTVAIGYFGTLQ